MLLSVRLRALAGVPETDLGRSGVVVGWPTVKDMANRWSCSGEDEQTVLDGIKV